MTYRPKPNCKVCKAIAQDVKIKTRIYNTSYYTGVKGGETFASITRFIGCSPQSLRHHTRYHQIMTNSMQVRLAEESVKKIAMAHAQSRATALTAGIQAAQAVVQKEAEAEFKATATENSGKPTYASLWDAIINIGIDKLQKGTLIINSAHVLKAAADKAAYEDKKKDRQLEMTKMLAMFASGGKAEPEALEGEAVKPEEAKLMEAAAGRAELVELSTPLSTGKPEVAV